MSPEVHPSESPEAYGAPLSRRAKLWWIFGAVAVALLLTTAVAFRLHAARRNAGARAAFGGPITVGTARVGKADVPITLDALGTVTPLATVTVHPQVTGPLTGIAFAEGQMVRAGDLLAQIDPRPFQASLDQAEGQLQRDQALLANAQVDLDRYRKLVAQNSISEQQYATQKATVSQDEATIAADKAAVETAALNLSYCRITAPVSGRVGLRQVDVGNLIQANTSSIAVITQLQPISVVFTVPEDYVPEIIRRIAHRDPLAVDAYDRTFATKLTSGHLSNADNQIDTATGTLKLRALFDNAGSELFPNQFVNVRLLLNTLTDQVVAPAAAVLSGTAGSYVYLVNVADRTVSVRPVTIGPTSGTVVAIRSGLEPGDTVVVDGADQLRDGAHVMLPGNAADAAGAAEQDARPHHRRPAGNGAGAGAGGKAPEPPPTP